MAWNEPGGSKDNDPWGNRNRNDQGPPDLDEVIRKLNARLGGLFGGNKGGSGNSGEISPALIGLVFIVLLVIWAASGMFLVDSGKKAVILEFGAYKETREEGFQWYMPLIQSYHIVDVSEIRSVSIGASTHESLMLTEDENIVEIKPTIQYRVSSAEEFLFNVRDPERVLRQVLESAIREVVGKNKMDYILTEGREAFASEIGGLAQAILNRYKTGLIITKFTLQSANAPQQVQHAFEDVNAAREDQVRFVNEAEAYRNDVLPKARGEAAKLTESAKAYKERVIAGAEGEASRFSNIYNEYKVAKEVTRKRLYLDAMESVLANTNKVVIDNKSSNNLLYLPLGRGSENMSIPGGAVPPIQRMLEQQDNKPVSQQDNQSNIGSHYKRYSDSRSRPPIQ